MGLEVEKPKYMAEHKKPIPRYYFKNRLGREFEQDSPNKVWVSGITYVTLEFFVAGSLEEMLEYSTVGRCPEILDTIDQLISTMKNPYAPCTYSLCYDWISQHSTCYIVEFETLLPNMDTFNPINYMDAYNEIKGCFTWSKIAYNDYCEHRVPQRVFDNRFLINRLIDVYIYGSSEQYGSLLPGLSIAPDALKIYKVENNRLVLT